MQQNAKVIAGKYVVGDERLYTHFQFTIVTNNPLTLGQQIMINGPTPDKLELKKLVEYLVDRPALMQEKEVSRGVKAIKELL